MFSKGLSSQRDKTPVSRQRLNEDFYICYVTLVRCRQPSRFTDLKIIYKLKHFASGVWYFGYKRLINITEA